MEDVIIIGAGLSGLATAYQFKKAGTSFKVLEFDFLWMLHTMDYKGRDNFGNILLRIFSVFGLFTVASGFVLFFISAKTFTYTKYIKYFENK
jgi:predicted oxidoreductase